MTILKDTIRDSSYPIVAVADLCGVSANAMYSWVNGRKPLPRERAVQIAKLLDVPEDTFDAIVSDGPTSGMRFPQGEPETMLAWLAGSDFMGLKGSFTERAQKLAKVMECDTFTVRAYLLGERKMKLTHVRRLGLLWPTLNLLVFQHEVDWRAEAEAAAVEEAVKVLGMFKTFEAARRSLRRSEEEFYLAADDWKVTASAVMSLDDGREVSDYLLEKAKEFAR